MVLEREGLHLERRRQEASSKVVQRQHRVLLSWVRDDAGRQTSSAIIPHGRASRTLGKNQTTCARAVGGTRDTAPRAGPPGCAHSHSGGAALGWRTADRGRWSR